MKNRNIAKKKGMCKQNLFSFKNILKAYEDCRKNKGKKHSTEEFEINREINILKLGKELLNKTYSPRKSICFAVMKPVPREIFAASFRDRVVHHLIYNYIAGKFEKIFSDQSCACRKNKGTHYSFHYLKKYIKQITKNSNEKAYFLHLDIRSFFMSIDKQILSKQIKRKVKNPDLLWLLEKIIWNDPTKNFFCKSSPKLMALIPKHKSLFGTPFGKGLPIGNLTSQFFANIYLDELDKFVKHDLKVKYYLRYVDDFVLLHQNQEILKMWQEKIENFLKESLKLQLNKQKSILGQVSNGINWIGYIVKPQNALVRKRVVNTCKNRLYFFNKILKEKPVLNEDDGKNILPVINSYFGHFYHANTFKLHKKIYDKHFNKIKEILEPKDKKMISFLLKNRKKPA